MPSNCDCIECNDPCANQIVEAIQAIPAVQGPQGDPGADGAPGIQGPQGDPGADGAAGSRSWILADNLRIFTFDQSGVTAGSQDVAMLADNPIPAPPAGATHAWIKVGTSATVPALGSADANNNGTWRADIIALHEEGAAGVLAGQAHANAFQVALGGNAQGESDFANQVYPVRIDRIASFQVRINMSRPATSTAPTNPRVTASVTLVGFFEAFEI